jgi:hypothetical protein
LQLVVKRDHMDKNYNQLLLAHLLVFLIKIVMQLQLVLVLVEIIKETLQLH